MAQFPGDTEGEHNIDDDGDEIAQFSSPPCFMHEVMPGYDEPARQIDPQTWADVTRWRKAERERLIELRLAISFDERMRAAQRIAQRLDAMVGDCCGRSFSIYWPMRGEPDLRDWAATVTARGGRIALPVVVEKKQPMQFRSWQQGEPLERGIWNIPIPAAGAALLPDVIVAPLVGYDGEKYRLGYGGGYFDRTLAAIPGRPRVIGVGYVAMQLATIFPQSHDIPMDEIVVE